jgi:hypothetical protein
VAAGGLLLLDRLLWTQQCSCRYMLHACCCMCDARTVCLEHAVAYEKPHADKAEAPLLVQWTPAAATWTLLVTAAPRSACALSDVLLQLLCVRVGCCGGCAVSLPAPTNSSVTGAAAAEGTMIRVLASGSRAWPGWMRGALVTGLAGASRAA